MRDPLTEQIIAAAIEGSYLKSTGLKRGLVINFGSPRLVDGIQRVSP